MFQKLVSHNEDIARLVDKGYAVAFDDSNHLVVRDIPYLDGTGSLQLGAIVTKLEFVDQARVKQVDHQIFFAGAVPHGLDGKPIPNLGGGPAQVMLSEASRDVPVQRSFSNKPKHQGNFVDFASFFEKIESYVAIISGPAMELHGANPYTFRVTSETASTSVFKLRDTLTSRAEIGDLAAKFTEDVIAIIGLGGTGAYVLDFIVKTPVREIRTFDHDNFHVHNAFRSPGRTDHAELGRKKADVYLARYDSFRTGLSAEPRFIDATSSDALDGVTFAFVCVDKGSSRASIFDVLIEKKIPFIDVGMGLSRKQDAIGGMVRATEFPAEVAAQVRGKRWIPETDGPNDIYRTTIQLSELNALNAALAVIRFKQVRAFYHGAQPYNLLFDLGDLKTVSESELDEV